MDTQQLFTLLLGFWVPGLATLTLYSFLRERQRFFTARRERYDRLHLRDYSPEQYSDSYVRDLLEQLKSRTEVQGELLRNLSSELATEVQAIVADMPRAMEGPVAPSTEKTGSGSSYRVVSELAHSLKTPLAQLESAVELLSIHGSKTTDDIAALLADMATSIDICKATLAAFRELTRVSGRAESWSPASLGEALVKMHRVYAAQAGAETKLEVALPDHVEGYSNNYILALLLPLLENAVEASPNELITVTVNPPEIEMPDDSVVLKVSNPVGKSPDDRVVSTPGLTTKEDHEGLGVSVVQHLLSANPRATSWFTISGGNFEFYLSLPRRKP